MSEFHNWQKCSVQPPNNPWAGVNTVPYVLLDDANSYGLTSVPLGTPYNDPQIAAASTVLYNAYGSPLVGEVIHSHTNLPSQGPMDWCWEYLGSTPTQINPQLVHDPLAVTTYISTSSDCKSCCCPSSSTIVPGPCINPNTGIPYQIEDIGPGGGIIFSIPGQGTNNTNYYFEVALHDVSTTQRADIITGQSCTADTNALPGAEFGVYKETILPGDNGTNVGDGKSNTAHLNSYPTSVGGVTPNPTNPVIDYHDLAARLCANYVGPNGDIDWFLPSQGEFIELVSNLGPVSPVGNVIGLNTNQSYPADEFYWTSSVMPLSAFNHLAVGVKATTGLSGAPPGGIVMDRCTTGSVRPVRMFECIPTSPCSPPNGAACIEYNYRDYAWGWFGTGPTGGLVGHLGQGSYAMPGTSQPYQSTSPWYGMGDSVIGNEVCIIGMGATDVMGNNWNIIDWQDDSIGYTISVWDRWYNFLGKWHYAQWLPPGNYGWFSIPQWNQTPHSAVHPLLPDRLRCAFKGVTHLEGPDPVVSYNFNPVYNGGPTWGTPLFSATKAFFKIEAACNTNLSTAFEIGTNVLFPGQLDTNPTACVSGTVPGFPNIDCIPTFGTYPISYTMYSQFSQCSTDPSCGSSSFTSNQGEGGESQDNFLKIQMHSATPKISTNEEEKKKLEKSKIITKLNQYKGNKEI